MAAALAVSALASARVAESCSCIMPTCGNLASSDAVFEATVVAIETLSEPPPPGMKIPPGSRYAGGDRRVIRLKDVKSWRGEAQETLVTGMGSGDCGYPFTPGERYLIDAHKTKDGGLSTGICNLTRPVRHVEQLIEYLEAMSERPRETRVWGGVFRSTVRGAPMRPVADAIVTLHGPKEIVARTDARGRFLVTGLAHGSYSATARVPGVDTTLDPYRGEFELQPDKPHACAEVFFEVPATGSVTGVVLNERGEPMSGAFVTIDAVNTSGVGKPFIGWRGTETDGEGRYFFIETPPGTYRVVFGSVYSGQILARTGTGETTFEVKDGESVSLEPLLRRPVPRLPTEVTVRDPDGLPVANIEVQILVLNDNDEAFDDEHYAGKPVASDADGKLVVQLLKDHRYRLVVGSSRDPRAESTLVADGNPLTLVLRR